ncbi:hypothetical protein [Streptomyces poriticola]|uniref:hypothetical protein n=1 Tax=Streptomyces poriticola TaxID=3120506 RepID=UPI002FCDF4B5
MVSVAAVLSLSACGGGEDEDSGGGDKIAGADTGKKSPSPSASESADPGRPKIELPSDITYKFEWKKTGDPEKDAVLRDAEQRIKAVSMAIAEQDPLHEAYRFYSEGGAAAGSEKFIQSFVDHEARIAGVARYFREMVTVKDDGTASLVYCEDQSKGFNKYIKTGKTDDVTVSKDSYVNYASVLRKGTNGVWVTQSLQSQRGSERCQP